MEIELVTCYYDKKVRTFLKIPEDELINKTQRPEYFEKVSNIRSSFKQFFEALKEKLNLKNTGINKDIELLDSPGVLWPKIKDQEQAHILASFSSIKEEILNLDEIACFILKKLYNLYPEKLLDRYEISKLDDDLIEAYNQIGKKRGALSKGGITDYEKVSNIIIRDLKNGYFGEITFDRIK